MVQPTATAVRPEAPRLGGCMTDCSAVRCAAQVRLFAGQRRRYGAVVAKALV